MDVPPAYLVGTGGALGALARHSVDTLVRREDFPLSTLVVNVLGSFVLAALTFAGASTPWLLFLGTGVCGAFTTFSSFAYETVRLAEDGRPAAAAVNAAGNLLCSLAAVGLAWAATMAV